MRTLPSPVNSVIRTAIHSRLQRSVLTVIRVILTGQQIPIISHLGISTDCETCHTTNPGWQPAQFPQHSQYFELTGQHAAITDCNACHNGNYNLTSSDCLQCHQNDYNNAANPNHTAAGIPVTCEDCHTSSGWTPSTFNHTTTGFVLDGAHTSLQCSTCHQGTITGLNPDCVSCHQADYNSAANPNHAAAGLPVTCQDCHTTTAFIPSTFDHATTGFQLLGVHAQIQCSDCHQGTVTGLSPNCLPCHQSEYNSAPNHVAQGYPTNCDLCHIFERMDTGIIRSQQYEFPADRSASAGSVFRVPYFRIYRNTDRMRRMSPN